MLRSTQRGTNTPTDIEATPRGSGAFGLAVEPLGRPGTAQTITTSGTSAAITLAATTTRVSIYATKAAFFKFGTGSLTAAATDHYIADGERLDLAVDAGSKIAAIQATAGGTIYVTELA